MKIEKFTYILILCLIKVESINKMRDKEEEKGMWIKKIPRAASSVEDKIKSFDKEVEIDMQSSVKNDEFCLKIASLAIKSLYFEASAAPKPGVEYRSNTDICIDMNKFTSMASSSVLFDTFYNCALEGVLFNSDNYKELLIKIRPIGIIGEEKVFNVDSEVKNYKGIIFLFGIISAALGSLYKGRESEENINIQEICDRVKAMTEGMCDKELVSIKGSERITYCETLFAKYYIKGIRGEVESGLKTVLDFGLPVMKMHLNEGKDFNAVLIQVLLSLMAKTEDSYVLGRHDMEGLYFVKHCAKKALKLGGAFTEKGIQFIKKFGQGFY